MSTRTEGVGFTQAAGQTIDLGTVPTELAVTSFQLATGVFGGIAALLASRRLSQLGSDTIRVSSLILPIAVAGVSTVIGAFLLPGSGGA